MSILSKLTLIVPTYSRQNFALRNMRYWSGRGISVHVLDGSDTPIEQKYLKGLSGNIEYHHNPVSLYERLRYAEELVSTEYCSLLSDDEFFLPSGLEAAIQQLDQNQELVSCGGQAIGFFTSDKGILGRLKYPEFKDYSVEQDDAASRMYAHMAQYTPSTIYSVVRADVWKKAMQVTLLREYPVYAIPELQFELVVAFLGKSTLLDNLFWLRSYENTPIRGTDISLDPKNRFEQFWDLPGKKQNKKNFLDTMAHELIELSGGEFNIVRDSVEEAFNAYREFIRLRTLPVKHQSLSVWQKIIRKMHNLKLIGALGSTHGEMLLKDVIKANISAVTKNALKDIDEIVEYLEGWNRNNLQNES
ncbi:MAG: TIGR00180 family glycosyltransferase [Candidatus Electrothrix sp. ATG2]|nr:TIGR00180 family glycosyltransferase [Candidatus Electrothrix sp. ATG2]